MKKNKIEFGIGIDSIINESKNISKSYKDKYLKNASLATNQKEKKILKDKLLLEKNELIQKKLENILNKKKLST